MSTLHLPLVYKMPTLHLPLVYKMSTLHLSQVYKMSSPVRGRCLIINNKQFDNPEMDREGSEMDVRNISEVFQKLSFVVDQIHEDLSSQVR